MERDSRAYLLDVRDNCDLILDFVKDSDLTAYKANTLIRSAVERRFIVLGEALTRLKALDLNLLGSIPDAARIVAFRNILVHGYVSISDELVWEIVVDHVPILRSKCDDLLARRG